MKTLQIILALMLLTATGHAQRLSGAITVTTINGKTPSTITLNTTPVEGGPEGTIGVMVTQSGVISYYPVTGGYSFVQRDSSGNQVLGTPASGNLANCTFPTLNQSTSGNAATATKLATARTINGVAFDGSGNITVTAAAGTLTGSTLASGVTASSLTSAAGGSFGTNAFSSTTYLTPAGDGSALTALNASNLASGTVADARLSTNARTGVIGVTIDGGGSAITTGVKGFISVPYNCTIVSATLLADQTGSAVVDVWKDTYTNFPPVVGDTITASAKPTISAAVKATDATLTGWTTSVTAGDVIGFNVDSCSTITRLHLILKVTK